MDDDARAATRRAVGTMLKRSRGYALMTQKQLADRLGSSRRSVAAWEAGEHEQPVTVVLDWLRICNRPFDDLRDVCAPWELNPQPAESDSVVAHLELVPAAA